MSRRGKGGGAFRVPEGYGRLASTMERALRRACEGKGAERHASPGESFEEQPVMFLSRRLGPGFCEGQAAKKILECGRLPFPASADELLDAAVYCCAAAMAREDAAGKAPEKSPRPAAPSPERAPSLTERAAELRWRASVGDRLAELERRAPLADSRMDALSGEARRLGAELDAESRWIDWLAWRADGRSSRSGWRPRRIADGAWILEPEGHGE